MRPPTSSPALDELLVEDRHPTRTILSHRLDKGHMCPSPAATPSREAHTFPVFVPRREVRDQLDAEGGARLQHPCDRSERGSEIAFAQQRLQHAVWRHHKRKR